MPRTREVSLPSRIHSEGNAVTRFGTTFTRLRRSASTRTNLTKTVLVPKKSQPSNAANKSLRFKATRLKLSTILRRGAAKEREIIDASSGNDPSYEDDDGISITKTIEIVVASFRLGSINDSNRLTIFVRGSSVDRPLPPPSPLPPPFPPSLLPSPSLDMSRHDGGQSVVFVSIASRSDSSVLRGTRPTRDKTGISSFGYPLSTSLSFRNRNSGTLYHIGY